jgi:hypothetical protein
VQYDTCLYSMVSALCKSVCIYLYASAFNSSKVYCTRDRIYFGSRCGDEEASTLQIDIGSEKGI